MLDVAGSSPACEMSWGPWAYERNVFTYFLVYPFTFTYKEIFTYFLVYLCTFTGILEWLPYLCLTWTLGNPGKSPFALIIQVFVPLGVSGRNSWSWGCGLASPVSQHLSANLKLPGFILSREVEFSYSQSKLEPFFEAHTLDVLLLGFGTGLHTRVWTLKNVSLYYPN